MNELGTLHPDLGKLLDYAIDHEASDLHISAGTAPMVRKDSRLYLVDHPAYTPEKAAEVIGTFIGPTLKDRLLSTRQEIDFSFSYRTLRFRTNVFLQRGTIAASIRVLPNQIPDLSSLGVPPIVNS